MENKEEKKVENEDNIEQWNDVKDKKTNPIVIAIIVLIVLGLGYYIFTNWNDLFGEKKTNTPDTTEKEVVEKEEEVTFSNEELQKYVDSISPISIGPSVKIYNVSKVTASELSSKEKIEYVGKTIKKNSTSSSDYSYETISEEGVKKIVENVFGPNSYEAVTFNLGCGDYKLHEDDNKYYTQTGCGGTTDKLDQNIVISYKATKTKLEIITAYAFTDSNYYTYKDYDFKVKLDEVPTDTSDMKSYLEKYVKENESKLSHIIYVFESTDGKNYYFKEFTNKK